MLTIRKAIAAALLGLAVLFAGLSVPAQAHDGYPDATTARIARKLNGTRLGGWWATTLAYAPGCPTYEGAKHAEIVRIPEGHGRRHVGVIHVSSLERARKVRMNLQCQGVWFAQAGTKFVLPLVTSTDTEGGSGETFRQTAAWSARRLGDSWTVR